MTLCVIVGPTRWQAHAVLQIEPDHGTWVLDNRARGIRLRDDPRFKAYRWIDREEPGSTKWVSLAPDPPAAAPTLQDLLRRPG